MWFFYKTTRASLVVQWLRIHFATQKHRLNSCSVWSVLHPTYFILPLPWNYKSS